MKYFFSCYNEARDGSAYVMLVRMQSPGAGGGDKQSQFNSGTSYRWTGNRVTLVRGRHPARPNWRVSKIIPTTPFKALLAIDWHYPQVVKVQSSACRLSTPVLSVISRCSLLDHKSMRNFYLMFGEP